ncbi:MAG: DNA mismatch repair protein [Bacteroidota bacterium]|nr:DNA mismatch repair protein [Bacteroidota bacterium]MDX5429712.1 DNA mismatch repair protein [Bacteroidota bacterium]MDX5468493.1 DNA mismatch repair protein [Bacteroidota bacterium]
MIDFHETAEPLESSKLERYQQISKGISGLRLAFIVFLCFQFYLLFQDYSAHILWLISGILGFLTLVKIHQRIDRKIQLQKAICSVHHAEINFVYEGRYPNDSGSVYNEPGHPYSGDIDLFGARSLFHYLNRTQTAYGSDRLASYLAEISTTDEARLRQNAVKELRKLREWQVLFRAKALLSKSTKEQAQTLLHWAELPSTELPKTINFLRWFLPSLMGLLLLGTFLLPETIPNSLPSLVFILNLFMLGTQFKKMQSAMNQVDKIHPVIARYSELIQWVEETTFESEKLQSLQRELHAHQQAASTHIRTLSRLIASMDSLNNAVGAFLFNGLFLYHLHQFQKLNKWKQQHGILLPKYLRILGEFEALVSIANFSNLHDDFTFPEWTETGSPQILGMGHPLIQKEKRVVNDLDFNQTPLIILTGSNMSGKSTFLRSIGINMVLASAGAPLCAKSAKLQTLPVLASMRGEDSLINNESYFFAEVKRLQSIIEKLKQQHSLVLLDEILRGTNSEDKRNGTKEVIRRLVELKAIGIIATHDLEVCSMTSEYPELVFAKHFEVEIEQDILHFDYVLRDGVCRNKSASFLLKKMGVI